MTEPTIHPASDAAIAEAARQLVEGRLVAFPTETVYGLGADATNDRAVADVFSAKGRPRFNPLIVHVAEIAAADAIACLDERARQIADAFWPGPLTLVLLRRAACPVSMLATAGLETVAVRMPDHPVPRALIAAAGRPLAAPSANPSGRISPTTAAHVAAGLRDKVAMILDGGPCRVGLESTVLDLTTDAPAVLRPGGITMEQIEAIVGPLAPPPAANVPPRSPGLAGRHYAPSRPLRLNSERAWPGEALLAFGPGNPDATLNLSPVGDPTEAAANLFAMLRMLDAPPYAAIAVTPIPNVGLGRAINDRLSRAARPPDAVDGNDERGLAAPCVQPDMDDPV